MIHLLFYWGSKLYWQKIKKNIINVRLIIMMIITQWFDKVRCMSNKREHSWILLNVQLTLDVDGSIILTYHFAQSSLYCWRCYQIVFGSRHSPRSRDLLDMTPCFGLRHKTELQQLKVYLTFHKGWSNCVQL